MSWSVKNYSIIKRNAPTIVVLAIALVLSGAFGNIIDSVFYGIIFDAPAHGTATTLNNVKNNFPALPPNSNPQAIPLFSVK